MKIRFYRTPSGRRPVQDFILSLARMDQARFADLEEGIRDHGFDFQECAFRQLQRKLWEIKFKAPDGSYRIIYAMLDKETMVWLHAFKKDGQKTPKEALKVALQRSKFLEESR